MTARLGKCYLTEARSHTGTADAGEKHQRILSPPPPQPREPRTEIRE